MKVLHVVADITGDWRPSSAYDAHVHAEGKPGHSTVRVTTLHDLQEVFRGHVSKNTQFDLMDFHTHGSPGSLAVGSQSLTCGTLGQFRNRGFERMFRAGARIELLGCNVAENAEGELFLAEFGSVFLKAGGGTVKASTGGGVADVFVTGNVYHPTGRWITCTVRSGGGVSLTNHRYLHPDLIRKEFERWNNEIQHRGAHVMFKSQLESIQNGLKHVTSSKAPAYSDIYQAYILLASVARGMRHILYQPQTTSHPYEPERPPF